MAGGAIVRACRACGACSTNRHVPADVELIIKQNSRLISEKKNNLLFSFKNNEFVGNLIKDTCLTLNSTLTFPFIFGLEIGITVTSS